jgi:hypothetical protein
MRTVTFHGQFGPNKADCNQPDIPVSSIEDILEIVSIFPVSERPVQGFWVTRRKWVRGEGRKGGAAPRK